MFQVVASLWSRMPLVGRLLVTAWIALTTAALIMLYTLAREDATFTQGDMDRSMTNHLAILPAS
jgi:hypothetical protein